MSTHNIIDISNAGMCNEFTRNSYFKYKEGCVSKINIQFTKNIPGSEQSAKQLHLNRFPNGENSLHSALLHRPNDIHKDWKIIDETYIGNIPINFIDYIKMLEQKYEDGVDNVRISWNIERFGDKMINNWLIESCPGEFNIPWSTITSY